jgi:hypothetical protein
MKAIEYSFELSFQAINYGVQNRIMVKKETKRLVSLDFVKIKFVIFFQCKVLLQDEFGAYIK